VRELANLVERLTIIGGDGPVSPAEVDLTLGPVLHPPAQAPDAPIAHTSLTDALDAYERTLIERAVNAAFGNLAEAARRLDTDRANLYRRMRRLGLSRNDTDA
jgi:two-component system nitrogen regulation response regulator NtrX